MTSDLVILVIIALAWFGVGLIFRKGRLSLFVGMEYLLIGFFLSHLTIPRETFLPVMVPFLGWIGLLIGLQAKGAYLRQLPGSLVARASGYTLASTGLLAAVLFSRWPFDVAFMLALALTGISFRTVSHLVPARGVDNRRALFFVSIVPMLQLVMLTAWHLFTGHLTGLLHLSALVVLGGAVCHGVLRVVGEGDGLELATLGLIVLVSEGAAVLGVSPLVALFLIGIWLANQGAVADELVRLLQADEKPLTMVFLMLAGMLAGVSGHLHLLFGTVLLVLTTGLIRTVLLKQSVFGLQTHGWTTFLAPGSLAVAIAADAWLARGAVMANDWFPPLLLAALVLQFSGAAVVRRKELS